MAMAAATSRLEVPGGQALEYFSYGYGRDRDATIRSQNELAQLQLAAAALHKHLDSLDSLAAWAAPVQAQVDCSGVVERRVVSCAGCAR